MTHPDECTCDECLTEVIVISEMGGGCAFPNADGKCAVVGAGCVGGGGCHYLKLFKSNLKDPSKRRDIHFWHFISFSKKLQKKF